MTDLEKFKALMESFGLTLHSLPPDGPRESRPYDTSRVILMLDSAYYDLGCDYPPVFVFDGKGRFEAAGSTV